jgi:hypothetical protein
MGERAFSVPTIEPFVFNTQYSPQSLLNMLPVVSCDIVYPVKLVHERVIVLSYVMSGWEEFTDGCISEWTCGCSGQVITAWSHSRSSTSGQVITTLITTHTILLYISDDRFCCSEF